MKSRLFKPMNEPMKPVQLFRASSREFEHNTVLFFAERIESSAFSRLRWSAQSEWLFHHFLEQANGLHQI